MANNLQIDISPPKVYEKSNQSVLQHALLLESVETVHILVGKLYNEFINSEKHKKVEIDKNTENGKKAGNDQKAENDQKSESDKKSENGHKSENDKKSINYDGLEITEKIRKQKSEDLVKCRQILKFLLSQEIDLNFPDSKYSLLLHFVMMHGDEEIFKFTLQESKNLELHSPGPENQTILHYAAYENKKSCIKHLLDFGIDINIGDYDKRTALHYAIRKNNPDLVNYLLSLGADVNKKTRDCGFTPLHIAVVLGNKNIIKMLLKAGADVKAKCESGRTTGQPRCKINHQSSMLNFVCGRTVLRKQISHLGIDFPPRFLINYGKDRNQIKMIFNKEMIQFLLEKGADTEVYDFAYDENNATPLHRACEIGRLDIVKLLLDYKADPYSQDCFERTMLHYAVLGNNIRIVDLLLGNKKFDLNVKDKYGRTPLYNFVQENVKWINRDMKNVCRISMVDFLVDNGAEVNVHCGTVNNTPLHWASRLENPNLIESLLELKADYKIKDKNGHVSFTDGSFNKNENSEFISLTESGKVLIAFMALTETNFYNNNDCNLSELNEMQLAEDLFQNCRLEVEKMKKTHFCDKINITFYTFLTYELMKVSKFARSEEIMHVLESVKYKNEFPCYDFLLKKRIERVKEMLFIENYLSNFIEEYAKIKLPVVVIDKILSYLNVGNFRNFGRALSLLKRENYGVKCH